MKKILLLSILSIITLASYSQAFKSRIITGDEGYLYYQMSQISGTTNPDANHLIGNITFGISWADSYADLDVLLICSSGDYNIEEEDAGKRTDAANSLYYRKYANYSTNNFAPPENWVNGTWYTIAKLKVTDPASGTVDISIYTSDGFNFSYDADGDNSVEPSENYTPTLESGQGSVSGYNYPTVVYNLVWTGNGSDNGFQNENSWNLAANWSDNCGGGGTVPTSTDNCYIPSGLTNYPENINKAFLVGTGLTNYLKIENGANISFGSQTNTGETLNISGKLEVYGIFNINANAGVSVSNDTYLDASECLVIKSDENGTGSFIDNGTITYGTGGSAQVQTYLSNNAGNGNLDIHLVGSTVDQISGGTNGVLLEEFNLINGSTYAYEWNEDQPSASGWQNINSLSYQVLAGAGIGLSVNDGSSNTLELTGELMTGSISTPTLTYNNNHYELLSNPYPSSIDFDASAIANSTVVYNKYWIWDATSNSYIANSNPYNGDEKYIQVGQGFFVETNAEGVFSFANTNRTHSNVAFREIIENMLTIYSTGGQENYQDKTRIRFAQSATTGYDIEIEATKWKSQNDDATQISTIAEDNTELSINVLPTESLNRNMVSVPMNFSCGYNTNYQLSFEDIESFETGTEIWLEDKITGGEWVSVNLNPDYSFTASADDPEDRFVIHFFGPTAIDENGNPATVDIYSHEKYAYIRNNTNETIKKIGIYTISGKLLFETDDIAFKNSKYYVSERTGYYAIRVITDKNVYTEKVFISK